MIPIAKADAAAPELPHRIGGRVPTCHGCKHCHYTAMWGLKGDYPGRPEILAQPHSRCTELGIYVKMIMGPGDKWLASDVPRECPEFRQPSLPGLE